MYLDHITIDGKSVRLIKPIAVNARFQDSMYFCQNEDLGIASISSRLEECIKDFREKVLFVWNEYGKASDDILTDGAKELKRRIQQYVMK